MQVSRKYVCFLKASFVPCASKMLNRLHDHLTGRISTAAYKWKESQRKNRLTTAANSQFANRERNLSARIPWKSSQSATPSAAKNSSTKKAH
jgi:hypothetical protein